MDNKEYIFNQALKELKKGKSKSEALLEFAEHKEELLPLLELSEALANLPKNSPPEPSLRRKYILEPSKRFWFVWLPFSRFITVSVSSLLLISASIGVGFGAYNSVPGQTLFNLKHASEQIQLKLAISDQAKASLQVKIAQKRLNEAETVFSKETTNPEEEKAALTALVAETKNSIEKIGQAAKNNALDKSNHPLVASLENLNKQQEKLINEIKPQNDLNEDVKKTLAAAAEENSNKLNEIKNYIAIASSESSLADLDSVSISGALTKISSTEITVENTSFVLQESSVIADSKGNIIEAGKLEIKSKVSVTGKKQDDKILAQKIIVILPENPAEVKGTATTTDEQITPGTTTPTLIDMKKPQSETINEDPAPQNNETFGSFILEDPAPQNNLNK